MSNNIQEGDHVIFRRDATSRVFHIRRKRQVYFEKQKFSVEELIDQPYGSTFELERGKLTRVEPNKSLELETGETAKPGADNRNLLDLDSNQKMSKEDIMKLKEEGIAGEKIIEKLIENSETFHSKTEFSQAKFIKKKKKRHLMLFTVLRPTPRLILDIFAKEPGKICNLRCDSLSQLLNYSNVMRGSRVAVVETCQGLVLACVLQRLGGSGKLIQLVPNNSNNVCRQVMDYFSFPKEHWDLVYSYPMNALSALERGTLESVEMVKMEEDDAQIREIKTKSTEDQPEPSSAATGTESSIGADAAVVKEENCDAAASAESVGDSDMTGAKKDDDCQNNGETVDSGGKQPWVSTRAIQREARAIRQKEAAEVIAGKQIDSLIIACKFNPVPILKKMLKFMPPSKNVTVFCQFMDPLKECYTYIKDQHLGLQVRLTETWFRQYQVLPQRTHPHVNMSGTGGYLLTFITIKPFES